MKNFKNIAMAVAACVAIVSCNDAIDIVQDGEINPDIALTNVTNLENYLNGAVYGSMDNSSAIKYTSLFTDELRIGPSNTGQDLANFRWVITPNNGYAAGIWSENYTTINRVNTLVASSEKITPSSTEGAKFNSTVAEARAIRALAYLNLMTYFSTDTKNDNALGVMLPLKPMAITEVLPRVLNAEVWAAMEADLNFAYANVGYTSGNPAVDPRPQSLFLRKGGINAIRARMYLYRGNYVLAKQYAQQAITDAGLAMTIATPIPAGTPGSAAWNTAFYTATGGTSPYRQMWVDTVPGENIFKLSRPSTGTLSGIAALYTTNLTSFTGAALWSTGLNLFSQYSNTANDIRRYAFVDPTSEQNFYIIDKYPGKSTTPLRNDIKLFRVTEMQLILAECAANGSPTDLATAATIIRNIRQARSMSGTAILPVYANVQAALRDILVERRVELAFEGHRFIDLKRLGVAAGVSISRNAADDRLNASTPLTLSITDYRWALPIPASEINGNPTIQQNPGY